MDLRESTVTEMIQRDDRSKWLSYSNHNIKCFTEGEVRGITSNYETIIGKGGFGEVYKGVLQDGRIVAVKKFMCNVEENFAKELKVHCEINHKNVVRLMGYCAEENALMIVSEYISQGNLSNVLHHECIPITLDTRLRIAVECSEALCYMHSQMYTQVIHGDIKPANILLDDNFNAKISDFGISRLVNTDSTLFTDHVIGSIGYMDPLFARSGRLTSKSDVYSFGIVLVELITKKKATIRNGGTSIVECFTQALATGKKRVRELFDVEISSQNNMKVLEGVAKLAGQCLRMEMDRRPEMIDVADRLRALRKSQVQGKQTLTIFPWGWRNKPAGQNNWQSSNSVTQQSLPSNLCRHFSLREMKSVTRNFDESHLIGVGRSCKVYYGMIDGGATKVAIKRSRVEQSVSMFQKEIAMMAKLRHLHLVSLVGFCKEKNEMILIYDYMAYGTLCENLYGNNTEEPPLTWRQRLDVCIGAARALHYLHECSIIPNDVSTANILLDERLVGKVSSTVSLPQDVTHEIGKGCFDPEFFRTWELTEKSNVYSFGAVLFEVLCARAAWDPSLPRRQANLVECALNCQKKGILDLIVDPYLEGKIAPRCLRKFVEIAEKCVSDCGIDRPTMQEVLQNLEMCLAEQNGSLGDEMSYDDDIDGPSRREQRLNLEMYLAEDDDSRYCSEISTFEDDDMDGDEQVADSMDSKLPIDSNLCRHFSLREMKSATGNFDDSHLVGVGRSGKVYYGMIDGGATKVAIKPGRGQKDLSKFQTEIAMMAKLRHHHLVSLVGYCKEKKQRTLIYDYMARGTLRENLYAYKTEEPMLTWRQRLDICIGAARTLHYLHECSVIPIDVSTTNILLDERLVGKFSSIASLRQDAMDVTMQFVGVPGFLDDEFLCTGKLTEKSNVYSFGVVLFEVLCARAAWDPNLPRRQANLVECALSCQKMGIFDLIVDPYLEGKISPRCLNKFVEIAEECVSNRSIDRPSMQAVLEDLELCLAEQNGSLADETPDDDGTNGPSRRERRLNLEMYLAEDDDWSDSSSEISTFEDDGMDWDEEIADSMDSKLLIDSNFCQHFSLREMKSATGNFDGSHLVSVGESGQVYYGVIDGGATKVAVKRGRVEQDLSKFQTEIAMMAKLRHHHLVSLVGYCKEENEKILIYDYMARGTLRGNLYDNSTEEPPLTWRQRLDVCIGAARALQYLHECSIIHNDVSTTSILLDERLVGKVSSEVSQRQHVMNVSTGSVGRHGYHDPEYYRIGQLTEKSNVYSFGVVLFEVLCARAAYDPNLPTRQAHLVECALHCQRKGVLDLIVDPYLEGKIAPRCFKKFVAIAEKCVNYFGFARPSMQEVLENLESCLAKQSGTLGDEMPDDDGTNGLSRREHRLSLEMYIAEDDDCFYCRDRLMFEK